MISLGCKESSRSGMCFSLSLLSRRVGVDLHYLLNKDKLPLKTTYASSRTQSRYLNQQCGVTIRYGRTKTVRISFSVFAICVSAFCSPILSPTLEKKNRPSRMYFWSSFVISTCSSFTHINFTLRAYYPRGFQPSS